MSEDVLRSQSRRWAVQVPAHVATDSEIYLEAMDAHVTPSGALHFTVWSTEFRMHAVVAAFAPGHWQSMCMVDAKNEATHIIEWSQPRVQDEDDGDGQ